MTAVTVTEVTAAITAGSAAVLDIAGDAINFVTSNPLLLFSVGVSFALMFIGVGRQILGR